MTKELIVPISSIVIGEGHYPGTAAQIAFQKAGVKTKPTTDVFAFPEPLPPYEIYYCPKEDAYIVRQL